MAADTFESFDNLQIAETEDEAEAETEADDE